MPTRALTKQRASNLILMKTPQWLFQSRMGVSSGVDGAPDGFGWTEALLASAVVLVPLTSRTLFQAAGHSVKKVVRLLFKKSVTGLRS